ncbi:hypothetical protein OG402_40845 [Streptomyces anulatus]|uniref:hypothetical protein n=1 Tax=Streptomyces anulatus TaxID=1892 RepID=UPI0022523F71|nr:hypothetical protein [Streptomyces anulatus]MCX4606776.1 hypothetical protein [Streptomyces anulatus]
MTPDQPTYADSKACGTCKALVRDGKPIEHEQCAARAVLLLPPDQPMYEDLVDLTDEQRKALPARFHTPVFDGLGEPNMWLCQVCWGDGWVSQWPCGPAQEKGAMVFVSEGAAEDIASELVRLRARITELTAAPVDEAAELAEGAAELEAMRREHPAPCRVPDSPDCTCPVTPDQALRIDRDRPESRTTHDCTLPLVRRLDCGHCPHEVCQDCDRCPHTCECASPEASA